MKKEIKTEKSLSLFQEIEEIGKDINKEYGERIVTTLGESSATMQNTLSTGSFLLDQKIGGGYVFGQIVEIYGQASSGKTTLALHAVAECQKMGKKVAYIDVENGLNRKYAENIGVKNKEFLIVYPRSGEEALNLVVSLINKGINLIVIDSVAALVPKAELEADLEKQIIGLQARMMSAGLRNITHSLINRDCIIIFINQIRNKINTGYYGGNPEITTGGRALAYFASLRINLTAKLGEKIEKGNEYVGIKTQAEITKNRFSSPYKKVLLEIIFGQGIQKERELIDLAAELDIIQKSGTWYSYDEKKLGQGKENATDYLVENSEICQEIEERVIFKLQTKIC